MKIIILFILSSLVLANTVLCETENLEVKIFPIKHGNAQSIYEVIEHLKSSEGKITVDPNTSSLIIIDHSANLERIASIIESLDVPQKQVEVTVIIADVTALFMRDAGIGPGHVVIPGGKLNAVLNMFDTRKEAKIRSQMTVRTLSNQPAKLNVSQEEIFGDIITRYSNGREVISVMRESVGDFLEVLPRVNNDDTITVTLRPSMSTRQEDGSLYERAILTQVVINNGDTLAIGGIHGETKETKEELVSYSGIVVGKRGSDEDKTVVMLLTATILE